MHNFLDMDCEEIVEEYADYLYQYALKKTGNTELAEDLTQETLLAAYSAKDSFSGKSSAKTWLISILKNKLVDHIRKTYKENLVDYSDVHDEVVESHFNRFSLWDIKLSNWHEQPDTLFEQKKFLEEILDCHSRLPVGLQEVFSLKALNDFEADEICEELKITANNLCVILYRARSRIRECMEKKLLLVKAKG